MSEYDERIQLYDRLRSLETQSIESIIICLQLQN